MYVFVYTYISKYNLLSLYKAICVYVLGADHLSLNNQCIFSYREIWWLTKNTLKQKTCTMLVHNSIRYTEAKYARNYIWIQNPSSNMLINKFGYN